MGLSPAQIKGRIKSLAAKSHADARALMRIYMMERFLERIAMSEHKDCFIIKGGILVTAMVGVAMRSTLDIDTTIINDLISVGLSRSRFGLFSEEKHTGGCPLIV